MDTKITIILCLLSLLATQIATVSCLDEDFTFEESSNEDIILHRNIRAVTTETKNELKAPVKFSVSSVIDFLVPKLLNTTLGRLIVEIVQDTPTFVSKVNNYFGKEVLVLKGNSLGISYVNLVATLKIQASKFLEENLKLPGFILALAEAFVNKTLDNIGITIKPVIEKTNFTLSSKSTSLQESDQSTVKTVIRKVILDFVIILIKPFQSRINQTLVNVTNDLLILYKPVLPNNYLESIVTCGINQTILKVIDVIDSIRETVNKLLSPSASVKKRSLDVSTENNEKQTRSLISLIISPIKFLLSLVLKPVYNVLRNTMNLLFANLEPIVGKIILSPIESIVMALIRLIPH